MIALLLCITAISQEITVRFTGQLNGTEYYRLDSVAITNLTSDWSETVEYPDTIIVLGGTVNVNMNNTAMQGLGQNIPNPFDCETRVELVVSQREDVSMQLLDVAGKVYAEYNGSLDAGMHIFDITAANPQTYLLNARVGSRSYSIRMVNVGSGCGSNIKYAGVSGGIEAKLTSTNEFHIGDNMRYVGYATIEGEIVESDFVEQVQIVNQHITLHFSYIFKPQVVTMEVTNVHLTSAVLNGLIMSDGDDEITLCGFFYGTSNDNLSNNLQAELNDDGSFSAVLENLSEGTTYYYCAYASNSVKTGVSDVMTFSTISVVEPTVTTYSAANVTIDMATVAGSIISDGYAEINTCGFYYGTSSDNLSNNITAELNDGNFSITLENLSDGTTYYYRAYAENRAGIGLGEILSFTTEPIVIPTIVTDSAAQVTTTSAFISGTIISNGNAEITSCGFYYGTSSDNLSNNISAELNDGNFSVTLENLSDGTTYYYRAYAENRAGIGLGEILSFTTELVVTPTIVTDSATQITTTSAHVSATIISDGNAEIISCGFYYGTSSDNLSNSISAELNNDNFSATFENLSSGTTYYYCAFASNRIGFGVGEVISFTTPSVDVPTVATASPTINIMTAILNGSIISDGGSPVTSCGFIYGTSSDELSNTLTASSSNPDFSGMLESLTEGTTYYYCAFASNIAGIGYGDTLSFTTELHAWVDLGLPSGTLWATCNLGANSPEGYGDFYAWGETFTKNSYTSSNYTYTDNPSVLPLSADAANVNWGANWRMPTETEYNELISNCSSVWTTRNGVYGRLVTGLNGNTIFFPAAGSGDGHYNASSQGVYWTSTHDTYYSYRAKNLYLTSSMFGVYNNGDYNYYGFSIRAVRIPGDDTSATLPTVVTGNATNVTTTGATLNGEIINAGNDEIIARGFVYGTSPTNLSYEEQCDLGTGSFSKDITGLTTDTTYYYRAYATNNIGTTYGDIKTFVTTELQLNGHDYVDLGLPSGTLWATCNVGANSPEEYGDYFAWGETDTKDIYNWSNYYHCNGSQNSLTKYCHDSNYGNNGFTDNLSTLESSDDAANANWGYSWRMPTRSEMEELIDNCTFEWTTQNGVKGAIFTSTNGNSIFLPAAGNRNGSSLNLNDTEGHYMSSNLNEINTSFYNGLKFSSDIHEIYGGYRYIGRSVRPVYNPNDIGNGSTEPSQQTSYTVTFNANGGNGTMSPQIFTAGVAQELSSNTFNKANNTFIGWNTAANGTGTPYSDRQSITISSDMTLYAQWEEIPEHTYVDLGLPSGTLWATCNVGANSPEEYGDYFAWGEITTKSTYSWSTYQYCNGNNSTFTKYCNNSSYGNNGFTDNLTTLEANDDAATANWGSNWRMPTNDEFNELKNNCTVIWTTQNGVYGRRYTGTNGNSIFLPAAGYRDENSLNYSSSFGYYWSSSLNSDNPKGGKHHNFGSGICGMYGSERYHGESIRPVYATTSSSPYETGSFTDTRDGNTYTTITIGEQTWMAENLRYEGNTTIGTTTSTTTKYRYYPNNNSSNVATYGYLYNWPATMNGASSSSSNPSGVQGICPNGWHLPSDAEWTQLTNYLSSQSEYQCGGATTNIAKSLASTTGWDSSTTSCAVGNTPANNNSTGFGALSAGDYNGSYAHFGYYAYFWSATEYDSSDAYRSHLYYDSAIVNRNYSAKFIGRSVRCVRN
ncbi:MAG: InlB B-repeat-containing protein [Bacteroidales bacterium]|nr:InlB B-repeat-containing protein [Bacteroidales bacterium]